MRIKNQVVHEFDRDWKIREADSMADALSAISFAAATGSVGARDTVDETLIGGGVRVTADVVELNSDGTERAPYQPRT